MTHKNQITALFSDAWTGGRGHRLGLWTAAIVYLALYLLVNTALVAMLGVYVAKSVAAAPNNDPLVGVFLHFMIPLLAGIITIPILGGLLKNTIGFARSDEKVSLGQNIKLAKKHWLPLMGFWTLYLIYFILLGVLGGVIGDLVRKLGTTLMLTWPSLHWAEFSLHMIVMLLLIGLHFINMGFLIIGTCLTCDKGYPMKQSFLTTWQLIGRHWILVIAAIAAVFVIFSLYAYGIFYIISSLMGYTAFLFIPADSLFPGNPLCRIGVIILMVVSTFWLIPYVFMLFGTLYKKIVD